MDVDEDAPDPDVEVPPSSPIGIPTDATEAAVFGHFDEEEGEFLITRISRVVSETTSATHASRVQKICQTYCRICGTRFTGEPVKLQYACMRRHLQGNASTRLPLKPVSA